MEQLKTPIEKQPCLPKTAKAEPYYILFWLSPKGKQEPGLKPKPSPPVLSLFAVVKEKASNLKTPD